MTTISRSLIFITQVNTNSISLIFIVLSTNGSLAVMLNVLHRESENQLDRT